MSWRRVKLRFVGSLEIEFVDRNVGIRQVEEFAVKGTPYPLVIYGPEGCGKTALLRQAALILEDAGYDVVYVNPMARVEKEVLRFSSSMREIVRDALKTMSEPYSRIDDVVITVAHEALRRLRRPRLAVLMDDVFQAVGFERAESYVKAMLNLIEYPPGDYDRIVVIITSSEGVTRWRVGRHRWAVLRVMWNMEERGFKELYQAVPGSKLLDPEEVWKITGGNPDVLRRLYTVDWRVETVVGDMTLSKGLVPGLVERWREDLERALEDPDYLWSASGDVEALARKLVELNLIAYGLPPRLQDYWIDTPPPEKDLEMGIGRFVAWQTPLHREAVKNALINVE
ncbi:MAG: ATP-binding protein [Desulfurococcales archaeon]|nr:ATP-binding protein [Desulfurococcales archaeon]